MATNIEQITALYVGYYGRAPEPEGLNYWVGRLDDGMTLSEIAGSFSVQPESIAKYPYLANQNIATPTTFVTQIYLNLFNHAPDAEGFAYWTNELANGHDIGSFILDVISGAVTAPDSIVVANKVAVGVDFAVSATDEAGFVYDNAAASAALEAINGVDATNASVDAAKTETDIFFGEYTSVPPVNLTTDVDTFVGTAGNDTFRGVVGAVGVGTLTTADSIDGGAGTDTLAVTFDAVSPGVFPITLPAADINNIENFEVRNVSGNPFGVAIDFSAIAGEKLVVNDRSSGIVTFANLAADAVAEMRGIATPALTNVGYEAGVTAASVVISGGATAAAVTITGAALTSATITSEDGANTVASIALAATVKTVTVDAASNLVIGGIAGVAADTSITATGAGSINLGQLDANVDVVDASANTGGVTVGLDTELDTKFTGGAGDDTVLLGAAALTTGSVDGGAGTDILVANGTNLNSAATGAKYTNFETLGVAAGSIDLDNIAGITKIMLSGGSVTNLSAAQAGAIQVGVDGTYSISVKGATTVGQIDTVALTIDDNAATTGTITLTTPTIAGVEKLTVNAVDNVVINGLTGATALTNVTLLGAGTQSITVGAVSLAANTTIDGSAATGKLMIDGSSAQSGASTGLAITGGSADDTISGSRKGDLITGNAGNDMLLGGAGADTIIGGEGNDTIQGDGIGVAGSSGTFETFIMNFADLTVGQFVTLGSRSFIAGALGATAAEVATAFVSGISTTAGIVSGATLAGFTAVAGASPDLVVYTATTVGDMTNPMNSGTMDSITGYVGGTPATVATIDLRAAAAAADVLTGGAGNDAFRFAAGSSHETALDTITDLDLGTNAVGGRVDTLVFENAGATVAVVALTSGEQATVTGAATLADAADAVAFVAAADGNTVQFTYGAGADAGIYIFHNVDGNATFDAAADLLIKVTGVNGTLDASDLSVI